MSAFALVPTLAAAPSAQASTLDFRTVAFFGQQVPGDDSDITFSGFGSPVINALGQTAFSATLAGKGLDASNNSGIYSEKSGVGELFQIARAGQQAPGASLDVRFSSFTTNPLLNAQGQTAFRADLTGEGVDASNDSGIYSEGGGSLNQVARTGDPSLGEIDDIDYTFQSFAEPVFNNEGQTAFRAFLTGKGVAFPPSAVYSEASGALAEIAREGMPAPGAGNNVNFDFVGEPVLNVEGETAFFGFVLGTGGGSNGFYRNTQGELGEIIREGEPAPGAGVDFEQLFTTSLTINAAGEIAFSGRLDDSDRNTVIYSGRPGALTQVVSEGDLIPGFRSGLTFDSVSGPVINATGDTAFAGTVALDVGGFTTVFSAGIFREVSGSLTPVATIDDAVNGFGFSGFSNYVLNAEGQVAFIGLNGDPSQGDRDQLLAVADLDGQLVEIAREGGLLDVNSDPLVDDLRTITQLSFLGQTGNEDGRGSGFNDLGQLTFSAVFDDGTSGVFVATIAATLLGDYSGNGIVDAADYTVWQDSFGSTTLLSADGNGNGIIDAADYTIWQDNFGNTNSASFSTTTIPEPTTAWALLILISGILTGRYRRMC